MKLARTNGLGLTLALAGAAALCGALSWTAMAGTADAKPAGVSAKYRGACSSKSKGRKSKAGAKAKAKAKASRKGRRCGSCRTGDSTLTSQFLTAQAGTSPIWRDDCTSADPMPLYGGFCGARADGQEDTYTTNVNQIASGRLALASNGGPGNAPYRQLTVASGDQAWGNRAALGYDRDDSPVALWHEGQYRMLNTWVRLGQINQTSDWRELFEIKQAQPYPSGMSADDGVMFEVQQRSGRLFFMSHWHDLWSVPISAGSWVPISVEGLWSADPAKGWLRFQVGDQVSSRFNGANLLRNDDGSTVPSFLEMGPYQSSSLPGFSMGFAGLSVYG
jgi:hypothetical protein